MSGSLYLSRLNEIFEEEGKKEATENEFREQNAELIRSRYYWKEYREKAALVDTKFWKDPTLHTLDKDLYERVRANLTESGNRIPIATFSKKSDSCSIM